MENKKNRIHSVKQFLETTTDQDHPVTMRDILTHLEDEGISASRKSVSQDIEQLIEADVDIVCNGGQRNEYFIGSRHFELPELKLLVDAVQASRFISRPRSAALIGKLTHFASIHQADKLRRTLYTNRQTRPISGKAYITVDLLHEAVYAGKKVTFKYYDWNGDKEKVFKHRRRDYMFSPYGLIWNSDHYYTVGWSDSHGKVITLRVDRIAAPAPTDIPAVSQPEGFDMSFYSEAVFQMYDGPMQEITLRCEDDLMKSVIDRFGEDVDTKRTAIGYFVARVHVPASPTFFAWVFSFGGRMRIIKPEDVANSYRDMARKAAE